VDDFDIVSAMKLSDNDSMSPWYAPSNLSLSTSCCTGQLLCKLPDHAS